MLFEQIRTEFIQNMRIPEFVIGVVVIPVMLYLMFGASNAGNPLPEGTSSGTLLMISFSAYGLVSLAIFTFGSDIAEERARGWLKLIKATPAPSWVYFAGKLAMSLLFDILILLAIFVVAYLFGGVRLPLGRWLIIFFTLLLGALSFSTFGFALGFWARPRAATTIANLIFLPLSFASGFFFPLSGLPVFLQKLAPYLPTYHYGELAWGAVGRPGDVALFLGQRPGPVWVQVLWLLGSFVLFGVLAAVGYRRDRNE